jgi:hypothetical protein
MCCDNYAMSAPNTSGASGTGGAMIGGSCNENSTADTSCLSEMGQAILTIFSYRGPALKPWRHPDCAD